MPNYLDFERWQLGGSCFHLIPTRGKKKNTTRILLRWTETARTVLRHLAVPLRQITSQRHSDRRPVAAGSHEDDLNKESWGKLRVSNRHERKASVSVFSASNQPSLSASIFILDQICFHCLVHLSLMGRAVAQTSRRTHTNTHTRLHKEKKFIVHRIGNLPLA